MKTEGRYLKSIVYGGMDGIVTTFAVVSGVTGAALSNSVILILGFANLIADGLSMAIGDYLSTKSEHEYYREERRRESWEYDNYPEGERREMIEFYKKKGLPEEDSEALVERTFRNKKVFLDLMMAEELGLLRPEESPLRNGIATFLSFATFGFIPLVTFVLSRFIPGLTQTFLISSILTGMTLFFLGSMKSRITGKNWIYSGTETLLVGGVAAIAAYTIGHLLSLII